MVSDKIKKYVKACLSKGYSKDQIKLELKREGYPSEDIGRVFSKGFFTKKKVIIFLISLLIIVSIIFGFTKYRSSQFSTIERDIINFKEEGSSLEQGYDYCDKKVSMLTMPLEDYCYAQLAAEFKSYEPCYKAKSEGVRNICIMQNDITTLSLALKEIKTNNTEEGLKLCDKMVTMNVPCILAYVGVAKNLGIPLDSSICDKMFIKEGFKINVAGKEVILDSNEQKAKLESAKEQCYEIVRS